MALIKGSLAKFPPAAGQATASVQDSTPAMATAPASVPKKSMFSIMKPDLSAPVPRSAPSIALPSLTYSDEQNSIIHCDGSVIVANAYAGTGKTSMLRGYTEHRPSVRFLYAAFSKALQLEAEGKFGRNTLCKTTHSLAWPIGKLYQDAGKLRPSIKPLDITDRYPQIAYVDARRIVDTITAFFASTDEQINENHLPIDVTVPIARSRVIEAATKVWAQMIDLKDPMPIVHDGYLKLYAMSKPDLSTRFDTILFDEAQDANPVTSQIILSQKKCKVLVVGDRYQSIFGFRGAENAMETVQDSAENIFYLTRSFRFGKGIADLASNLLADFRGATKPLVGLGHCQDTRFKVDHSKQHAILSRTNGGVFRTAVDCVMKEVPFSLITGVDNYQFNKILDTFNLHEGASDKIRDNFIRRFPSFMEASEYAEEVEDKELSSMIKIVEEYRSDIPGLIEEIKKRSISDREAKEKAIVQITTAHRSKGLEFDQVVINDDYPELMDGENGLPMVPESREDREEIHLAYVATTRAREAIQLNPQLQAWVDWREGSGLNKTAEKKPVAMEM